MYRLKKCICQCALSFTLLLHLVQAGEKSSLTFAIDDTGSMGDDIEAVKSQANAIFDKVTNSPNSQIEDFILVTFNDPEIRLRVKTRDRDQFKKALAGIIVDGGDDCPEMALAGIELALKESRPRSLLYVFTDASPKDSEKHEAVRRIAGRKNIQVVFVLTGKCGDGAEEVYYQVSKETNGQVFNLNNRSEVKDILYFVQTQIDGRKEQIANKEFPPGTHEFEVEVDSKMKELVVSVSGSDPKLTVIDPHGEVAPTVDVAKLSSFVIVKVTKVKPGTYKLEVTSSTRNSVVVTAETSVHFEHGFSLYVPTSIEETVTRPIPGEPTYLSIKLATDVIGEIILDEALIMDIDKNLLEKKPLKLINKIKQFYVTETNVSPPNELFRVAIRGHDARDSKKIITRFSLTPIEPQVKSSASILNKIPTVSIIGDDKINAAYNEPLHLKCKVSGYPKPKVVWQSDDGILLTNSTVSLVDLPYDYISTITIDRVISNLTYHCVARNDLGGDSKLIKVETRRKIYFNIIKKPIGATIELNEGASFECEVDASPPAEIHWYMNSKEILEDDNVKISPNRSLLVIEHMETSDEGKYACVAKNEHERRVFYFIVNISGVEPPVIDKNITEIHIKEGSDVTIPCSLNSGIPEPSILWFYKDEHGTEYEIEDSKDAETIFLPRVTRESIGFRTYHCEAYNDVGYDYHNIDLIIDYPPRIKGERKTEVVARLGEKINLDCDVEGGPPPTVKWLLNDTEMELTTRFVRAYRSHGIRFYTTSGDTGIYRCQAINKYGTVNKIVDLRIVKPASIKPPEESTLNKNVGEYLELSCLADGYPTPKLSWVFHSLDPKEPSQNLRPREPLDKLILGRVQIEEEGFYTCIASNIGGSSNISYEVNVFAPPIIENVYPEKTFTGVVGDLSLRVPCKATGNPKPEIIWIKDGIQNVATGTEWYDIEDGTLVIKQLDKLSAGTYMCEARNRLGFDREIYDVVVEEFPRLESATKTVLIGRGNSSVLTCDIPYKKTDLVRWFKDGVQISTSKEYFIINAKLSDTGIFTCRVSDFSKSRSGSVKVKVGVVPRFLYDEEEHIEFEEGLVAVMDCSAEGDPSPEVTWWQEGKLLPVKDMTHIFDMKLTNRGQYFCLVQNEFGVIRRAFTIASQDCLLDIESELVGNQPLFISTSKLTWPELETIEGHLKIRQSEYIRLACPSAFENFNKTEVVASCERDVFKINENAYKLSELQCRENFKPVAKSTGENCLISKPYAETLKVGYELGGELMEVYEICFDKRMGLPLYSKHGIHHTLANIEPKERKWQKNHLVSHVTDELYHCELQIDTISLITRKWFHKEDKCCFSKRLMVNPRDVAPGLPQMATYTPLNLVPHWSTCNSQNWESIERRVRALARSTNERLLVWTGTDGQLVLSGHNISIYDRASKEVPVPKYLWKVVQDPSTHASLAIVQLNIPDLTLAEAYRHLICRDICQEVSWMKSKTWRDVNKGYTFCCNVPEFERALGYDGLFGSGSGKVLYDVSFVPGHSLT